MDLIQKILLEAELDGENEFNLNSFLKPNPNQIQRYKKEFESFIKNIKLGLREINKVFENKQWESEEERFFLKSFYNYEVKVDSKDCPNEILIIKNNEIIAIQNLKYKLFVIDYYSIWEVFQNEFHWKYYETQSFMKTMLNKYFKLKDYMPVYF